MKKLFFRKIMIVTGVFVLLIVGLGQSAFAAKWADTPSGNDCIITEVFL